MRGGNDKPLFDVGIIEGSAWRLRSGNFTDRCSKEKVMERLGVSRALHSGWEFGRSRSPLPIENFQISPIKHCTCTCGLSIYSSVRSGC